MDYKRIYDELISKQRDYYDSEYYEVHHIIPRCMGGSDNPTNLIKLNAREHFIAHALLARFVLDEPYSTKLKHAFFAMCNQKRDYQNRYTPPSKIYEISKRLHGECMSVRHSGKILEDDHILKLREGHKKYFSNELNVKKFSENMSTRWENDEFREVMLARMEESRTDEYVGKVSNGLLEHYNTQAGLIHKEIISNSLKDRWKDDSYREKMKNVLIDKWSNMSKMEYDEVCKSRREMWTDEMKLSASKKTKENSKEIHKKVSCEHCNLHISRQNYNRFHGDKCKVITGKKHTQPKIPCRYCGKECSPSTLSRWHNENCKHSSGLVNLA
jgi:hypothetical protein